MYIFFHSPGPVFTSIGRSLGMDENVFVEVLKQMEPLMLLKHVAHPEEIANLASFLASDDAQNITG